MLLAGRTDAPLLHLGRTPAAVFVSRIVYRQERAFDKGFSADLSAKNEIAASSRLIYVQRLVAACEWGLRAGGRRRIALSEVKYRQWLPGKWRLVRGRDSVRIVRG